MHPGELLREEILPALERSKTEIARLLGVSRQTLYDVLQERQPVTPVMALQLGKLCGNGPSLAVICRSDTICILRSSNSARKSSAFRRCTWIEDETRK
jgi:addiction module HigA family antidote